LKDSEILKTVIDLRRRIHRHPELGRLERRTTELVTRTLRGAGIPFRRTKPTGAVAWLGGGAKSPCVALRADMDALPLDERPVWAHRSRVPGVMHACGHDAHTAMVLTAALELKSRALPPGTVKFFFQPDEEGSGGARELIRQGAMASPRVDAVFGVHVNPRLPAGTLGVRPGPLMAAVDRFTIHIRGEGGHGAYPHEGRDAVVMAAHVVQALQTVVSRRVDPVEPVVLTVGTIEGGRRFNILAEEAVLTGTVRTLSDRWHREMPRLLRETADGVVKALGGRCRVTYEVLGKTLVNDPEMAELALDVARRLLGARRVVPLDRPSMGGEDFSEYLQEAPGCYVYLGTGADARTRRPWHHPAFFLHEGSMLTGVRFLGAVAEAALGRLGRGISRR
jgi:amidohydrolase